MKQSSKLEKQNRTLAITIFGWEDKHVIVHRISEKDKRLKRINLMLIHKDENMHYYFVKRAVCFALQPS